MIVFRTLAGAVIGAAMLALPAPWIRPLFSPSTGGIGAVTVAGYPKSWDYAVIALLVLGAFLGGLAASRDAGTHESKIQNQKSKITWAGAAIVFVVMFIIHDHPYVFMDPFHEGERLTAGWLMKSGARPYTDFFIFHGLAADAGLDALTSSPVAMRRLQAVLDAATLALLVPIAAEVTATASGLAAAVVASLCASAAFWLPVFPYYRIAPVLVATLAMLRFARTRGFSWLLLAWAGAGLGILWSLDTGMYAMAGVVLASLILRARQAAIAALIALVLPFIVLLAVGAGIQRFLLDSFVIMPRSVDAIWSLPAPPPMTAAGLRYYLPPVFYGFLLALAFRLRDPRMAILAIFSLLLFRTAAGRVSWGHTRYAVPLLGIALIAFVLEPLFRDRRRAAAVLLAIPLLFYFEVPQNVAAGAKLIAGWRSRQRHDGMVAYRGVYTSPQHAAELDGLKAAIGPGTILDFSNERALYFLLERRAPVRVMEISMLSAPPLLAEAMGQLNANPPAAVIVGGDPAVANFDGVSNGDRVPDLARWIDANYPKRQQIGRYTVAKPEG
jgi:hypothetical protein